MADRAIARLIQLVRDFLHAVFLIRSHLGWSRIDFRCIRKQWLAQALLHHMLISVVVVGENDAAYRTDQQNACGQR